MKAMILAAGLGTRLRPLTLSTPKPLIKVAGKSLIEYQIENLISAGVRDIVINHAWLGEQIEEYLGDGTNWGVSIRYSAEAEPLETAGGVRKALDLLATDNDEPFMLVNGDLFVDISYGSLNLNLSVGDSAKLWLVANPEWHPEGDFALDTESRVINTGERRYTFSGISLLRPSLFGSLVEGEKAALAPILRRLADQQMLAGELLTGYWNDVGTAERLAAVEAYVARELKV